MAEKTFIVKLAGDSKSYQNSMTDASKALDKYQKQNLSTDAAVKSLSATLTKYISVAALVKGAQEALTKTIQGSQTTADAWAATMHACQTVVDNFFSSLSTGDFSSFNMGLSQMAAQAKAAAMAIDSLGNASMSWNYFQSARMADLTDLTAIVNDPNASIADRQAASQRMRGIRDELSSYAAGYEERALEAMARVLTEATQVEWSSVGREDLERILQLDLMPSAMSAERKAQMDARYQEYLAKVAWTKYDFETNDRKRERVQVGVSQSGLPLYQVIDRTSQEDIDAYHQDLKDLAQEYMDVVLYNEALVRRSDEWLQNLIAIVQQADNAERSMRRVNSSVDSAEKTVAAAIAGQPVAPKNRQMGALPGASGIALMDVSGPVLPTVLPETVVQLEDTEALMARIATNADNATDSFDSVGHALESLGSTFSQFGDSGWQMAGSILASTGAVVEAYNKIAQAAAIASAAEAAGETPTVWGKIAAITAMLGAFAGMVASVKSSVRSYAEGGIIPGQNYNDGITARVSSGEMIINQADQKRLYDSIHTGGVGGGSVRSSISGEQIVIAVNNWARRTNHGELVFAGRG